MLVDMFVINGIEKAHICLLDILWNSRNKRRIQLLK